MKKWVLMFGGALTTLLFLSACGSSMEDKEFKNEDYYKEHTDEAKRKYEWCLNKTNSTSQQLEALQLTPMYLLVEKSKLSRIDKRNCDSVFLVFHPK